jgi:uncharacterized protein HemY
MLALGKLYLLNKKYELSKKYLYMVIDRDEYLHKAYHKLAIIYQFENNPELSKEYLNKAIENGFSLDDYNNFDEDLKFNNNQKKIIEKLKKIFYLKKIDDDFDKYLIIFKLGLYYYYFENDFEKAKKYFEIAKNKEREIRLQKDYTIKLSSLYLEKIKNLNYK